MQPAKQSCQIINIRCMQMLWPGNQHRNLLTTKLIIKKKKELLVSCSEILLPAKQKIFYHKPKKKIQNEAHTTNSLSYIWLIEESDDRPVQNASKAFVKWSRTKLIRGPLSTIQLNTSIFLDNQTKHSFSIFSHFRRFPGN